MVCLVEEFAGWEGKPDLQACLSGRGKKMVCGCIVADERTEQRASICSVENGKRKTYLNNPIPERLVLPCTLFPDRWNYAVSG